MNVPKRDYDTCFDGKELERIHYLRKLDTRRKRYGKFLGFCTFAFAVGVSVVLGHLYNKDDLWVLGFWVGLAAGPAMGFWLSLHIDARIEREFKEKWDPLFLQRSPLSLSHIAAREEINGLIDSYRWYGLSEEQQRAEVAAVNRRHGIK